MKKYLICFAALALLAACDKIKSLDSEEFWDDDELIVPVSSLEPSIYYIEIYEGGEYWVQVKIRPRDATDQTVVWTSDNPSVASIENQIKYGGYVIAHAEGNAKITATAGGKSTSIDVKVYQSLGTRDYVDEYGVNHGRGKKIGKVIWAPVNCGYHAKDFKYGKLYQWGRRYGQGYNGKLYKGYYGVIEDYADASVPSLSLGEVSEIGGNHKDNANVFYYDYRNWVYPLNDKLWNSGTESNAVKTKYDPCPEGWRVPTYAELKELCQDLYVWDGEDPAGRFFCDRPHVFKSPALFLLAAGYRTFSGIADLRGLSGYYRSSRPCGILHFNSVDAYMDSDKCGADGCSVRCVQE